MSVQILGLKEVTGPLVALDGIKDVGFDEMAELILEDGSRRLGRVVEIQGIRPSFRYLRGRLAFRCTTSAPVLSAIRWRFRCQRSCWGGFSTASARRLTV